jgi:hypothetical protein
LLVAADRRHLRDDATQSRIGGAEDDRVAARVAATPQADPLRVDLGPGLQKGDGASPVGDLLPWVDVLARLAVAGAEVAVVVKQHDEAVLRECCCERLDPMLFDPGVSVRHGDRRMWAGTGR